MQEGLALAEASGNRHAIGWSLERLALLAQVAGSREEAHRLLMQGIAFFREAGDSWSVMRLLNHLGSLNLEQGNMVEAEQVFCEALQAAMADGIITYALDSLAAIALIRARQGFNETALKIVLYILQQPSGAPETKNRAELLRTELEKQLSQHQIDAFRASINSVTLEEIARALMSGESE